MSELDEKRLDRMSQRGGLPTVDELVAMWRVTGAMMFPIPDDRSVVTEARRRIRAAGKLLGKTQIRTLFHKGSGRMLGLMECTPEEQAVQDERLRNALADLYPRA